MTNEIDQLIWNVLDGKASEGEIRELKSWMEEGESHREYFRQWKKIWNMTSGPILSTTRKQQEKERFLKSIHRTGSSGKSAVCKFLCHVCGRTCL